MTGKGIFITGTDTGVGKTIAASAITRLLKNRGVNIGIMKPVTSGCEEVDGQLISEDAEILAWSAGLDLTDPDIAPYRLASPIGPSVAASMEGKKIDFGIIKKSFLTLSARHDFMIVEGAGGLMVPLAGGMLIADLIASLNLPVLVISRPGLGTINHTLLTCYSAKQLGLKVKGVVINNYPEYPNRAEESAPHLIDSLAGAPLLGVFPHCEGEDRCEMVEQLAERLAADPATRFLLKEIGVGY